MSAAALNTIIGINAAYIRAKGITFFTQHLLLDNPLTTDGFINDTLEHLRQTSRIALTRGDEQQAEQVLAALAALARTYATIDYGGPHEPKIHAHLAAGYLAGEVEHTISRHIPDVAMEGVRLMGQCAQQLLAVEGPNAIRTLVGKLGVMACAALVEEDYRPVTSTSVEQLAHLSFDLLSAKADGVRFAAEDIRTTVRLTAKLVLALPDSPLAGLHSGLLASYYSATSPTALSARLTALANAVSHLQADNKDAQHVIDNLEEWSDKLYQTEKEMLLDAIKTKSRLAFDLIRWIGRVTEVLIYVSNAPACDDRNREKLRHHALWLVSVLSFVPDDKDSVQFVENYGVNRRAILTPLWG